MSCADDLTAEDLNESVSTAVLERVSAGEGSNINLWGQIDRDKYAFPTAERRTMMSLI